MPNSAAATGSCRVESVHFKVDGLRVEADLYLPKERPGPYPCVVLNNGLGGTKDIIVRPFAERFCAAGIAAIAYDHRHFGTSEGEPRQLHSMPKQLEDCEGAVAYVRGLDEIDADRIAIWGTSAGAGYGFLAAAKDPRLACIVAQCAGLDHGADGKLSFKREGLGWMLRLLFHAQRDKGRSRFGLSPHRIPIVGRPGTTALLTGPGGFEGYGQLGGQVRNEICARVMITPHGKMPQQVVDDVHCPTLVLVCDNDELVSVPGTIGVAERLGPLAEIKRYPFGHFDIYRGEPFELAISDTLDFFAKHLVAATGDPRATQAV